jgi:hypothetical protein
MVIGGYCPGTAVASVATGKIDALVFIVGFLLGSLLFGDMFPVWGDFYNSDYMGVVRLDQVLGIELGEAVLAVIVIAITGSLAMRWVQQRFWPTTADDPHRAAKRKLQGGLIAAALAIGFVLAYFPTEAFIEDNPEPPYYIVPKTASIQ